MLSVNFFWDVQMSYGDSAFKIKLSIWNGMCIDPFRVQKINLSQLFTFLGYTKCCGLPLTKTPFGCLQTHKNWDLVFLKNNRVHFF